MKILPECYVCAMRQALAAAMLVSDDATFHSEVLREAAREMASAGSDITPPEAGEGLYAMISRMSGNPDPFAEQKKRQNDAVLEIYPWLRETVRGAADPLLMAVRLAIAGNTIDPGAQASFDLQESVREAVEGEGELSVHPTFAARVAEADTVLLVVDNCGEVVFDMLLIETMKRVSPGLEVTVAVRSGPIINDVTEVEARAIGLEPAARILPSGSRMPGTVLARTTDEFRCAFDEADLVISKGQGNWETLEDSEREVFFMFQAKCPSVAAVNRCAVGDLLLL